MFLPVGDLLSDGQVQELLLHLRHGHCPSHLLPGWIHAAEAQALCSLSALCICCSPEACCGSPGHLTIAPGRGEVSPAPGTFSHAGLRCLSRRGVPLCPQNFLGRPVVPHKVPQAAPLCLPRAVGQSRQGLTHWGSTSTRKNSVQLFAVVFISLLIAAWVAQMQQLSLLPSLLPCHSKAEEYLTQT